MGSLVAVLFCAYTVAKVQRDAIFLAEFGAFALPYAYVATALTSVLFVWTEGRILRRFTRIGGMRLNQYIAIACSIAAAIVFPLARHWTAGAFYLWTGSQAMILLPHFWSLALDVWDSRRARRLFPLFSAAGLLGGLVGGSIAGWLTPIVKRVGLMWILAALLIAAHVLTRFTESHRRHAPSAMDTGATVSRWQILARSRYLQFLAMAISLSVIVATFVDFQFKYFVQYAYPDPHELTQFLGRFHAAVNALALLFQVFVAGWLLRRLDLSVTTAIQPLTVMALGAWAAVARFWRPVVLLRGAQGVLSQVLGKSSSEIYYMAVRPPERRSIKPAIDTLAERWSDAVVGVLLVVALRILGFGIHELAQITVGIAAVWMIVLLVLNRKYRGAIQKALSSRWVEPEAVAESMRLPAARHALVAALRSDEERRILLALRLVEQTDQHEIVHAIRACLSHRSPEVRACAAEMMERKRLRDPEGRIEGFLEDPNESVRRAAVGYLLSMSREPTTFVRKLLDGDNPDLKIFALDALVDRPHEAPAAIAPQWIDARLQSGTKEDLLLAARAVGTLPGAAPVDALRKLLENQDPDVRRAAVQAATRRPSRLLLEPLLDALLEPALSYDARFALAAIGDAAVPALMRLLGGESGRPQSLAARTLALIGSPRAVDALMELVRSQDRGRRHLGLRNLTRVRVQTGEPVLARALAHRFFLRELGEYRAWLVPADRLEGSTIPELRLLAESYREFAEMALGRALLALACWYDPRALFGAFERLRTRRLDAAAPALEFLGHALPRSVFRPVARIFEERPVEKAMEGEREPVTPSELTEWIMAAWQSGDAWLRACAVRASRHVADVSPDLFQPGAEDGPVVRAEIEARFQHPGQLSALAARTAS